MRMSRPNTFVFTGILALLGGVMAFMALSKGVLLITAHEGDIYHLLDILFRLDAGQVQHKDFMTPLGILAFLPAAEFMERGYGVGYSLLAGQVVVAAVLLPVIIYAALTRLPSLAAYIFGVYLLVLIFAMIYGGAGVETSVSMQYNRWAWAIAFPLVVLAVLDPIGRDRPWLDGLIIGACLSALVLLKITFFLALLPGVVFALAARRDWPRLIYMTAAGAVTFLAMSAWLGYGFWIGYLSDLLTVAGSTARPYPGVSLPELISSPSHMVPILLGLFAYMYLGKSDRRIEALAILIFLPGLVYITYQNFGNDPKWLMLFAILLLALYQQLRGSSSLGSETGIEIPILASVAIALALPSAATLGLSQLRHFARSDEIYVPMLPQQIGHQDILVQANRAFTMNAEIELDRREPYWHKYSELAGRGEPISLAGTEFPRCELAAASLAFLEGISADLETANLPENSQIFTTDILTVFWLFTSDQPLEGGAPWYYGGLSGLENADFVLVPKCSFYGLMHSVMIDELNAAPVTLYPVRENELYVLFQVG